MKRSILALLLSLHSVSPFLHDWACGNEHMYWTQRVAWWIAKPAGDKPYINRCCQIHDEVMVQWEKSPSVDLEKSDDEFAECLKKSKFFYTRVVVRPIYYGTVRLYSIWKTGSWKKIPEAIWNFLKFW